MSQDNSYQGAGKSTLGNLLLGKPHDEGPFKVSAGMESCTQVCGEAEVTIVGEKYKLVDTPGIFDTQKPNEEVFNEIARTVHICAYGVKAILFVFEAKRFTEEQKNVLEGIRCFLGESAMDYIIPIFSHATKKQNENRDEMRKTWNQTVSSFIRILGGRWGISPNSDYFPPESSVHKARLTEIQDFIASTRGVYTTEAFEFARQEQEKNRREREEEEKRANAQYEENLRKEGKKQAEEKFKAKESESLSEMEVEKRRNDLLKSEMEVEKRRNDLLKSDVDSEKHAHKSLKSEFDTLKSAKSVQIHGNNKKADKHLLNPSCFALDTKVRLASGKSVEMSELQVGDLVLSNVSNNRLEFSEVYLISHLGHHDYPVNMVKIEFISPDGSKGQILMTPMHCIFGSDLLLLYAKDVVPGKTEILVLDKTNELIPVIVDSLVIEKDTGYISFYTRAGTVIANNILCSCYDDCPPSQLLMDLAFAPIRLWTKIFPSNHRQKELHPYVQILETAYVTWSKALEGCSFL
ncbi:5090_t:CDS:2 [Ambispora leptoticha]|uniref:5090_t:CDS:1 n=1 Tax=Ambispora leptoticha TaxID=144679 RepID=A0A9N9B6F7_9GLOM|nr:5090_t:CDS:2 [Ambispora leptoticha]